jgi:hypothetical protein
MVYLAQMDLSLAQVYRPVLTSLVVLVEMLKSAQTSAVLAALWCLLELYILSRPWQQLARGIGTCWLQGLDI